MRNLTDDVDEKLLGEVFGAFGDTEKVPVPHLASPLTSHLSTHLNPILHLVKLPNPHQVKKVKNFAFIHYVDRTHALAAIEAMHNEQVGGEGYRAAVQWS